MNVTINDQPRALTSALDVATLVAQETGDTTTAGIAVAVNGKVVPASAWNRVLTDGDTVDILTAVQGG